MSQDNQPQIPESVSKPLNVIVGGAGIGLLLAAAGFAFLRSKKSSAGDVISKASLSKASLSKTPIRMPNLKGKWALNAAIRMIEHDSSRKVLLGVLKAMAKRAK